MKILIDTHILLWVLTGERKLTRAAQQAFDKAEEWNYSLVSLWEIATKVSIGKLPLPADWCDHFMATLASHGYKRLGVEPVHCAALASLPLHHRDPFDRMIIAQAKVERLSLVTADSEFKAYGVKVVW
jgi:PIN domain nuclease of toxin-antitoxin system